LNFCEKSDVMFLQRVAAGEGSNCNMADVRLSFEERRQIMMWYWKFENVAAVQRHWRRELADSIFPSIRALTVMSFISNKMASSALS
ncbi:solute carrier organic anion transporter family member 2B1 X3, partial [Biomphalaria glabrata]